MERRSMFPAGVQVKSPNNILSLMKQNLTKSVALKKLSLIRTPQKNMIKNMIMKDD